MITFALIRSACTIKVKSYLSFTDTPPENDVWIKVEYIQFYTP